MSLPYDRSWELLSRASLNPGDPSTPLGKKHPGIGAALRSIHLQTEGYSHMSKTCNPLPTLALMFDVSPSSREALLKGALGERLTRVPSLRIAF